MYDFVGDTSAVTAENKTSSSPVRGPSGSTFSSLALLPLGSSGFINAHARKGWAILAVAAPSKIHFGGKYQYRNK